MHYRAMSCLLVVVVVVVGLSRRHDGSPDHEVVWVRRCERRPILDAHTRLQMSHVKPRSGGG